MQQQTTTENKHPYRCLAIDGFVLDINDKVQIRIAAEHLPLTIGRNTDCGVRINCPMVSRQHGEFYLAEAGDLCFRDHSANGTFVNERLTRNHSACITGDAEIKLSDSITLKVTPNAKLF